MLTVMEEEVFLCMNLSFPFHFQISHDYLVHVYYRCRLKREHWADESIVVFDCK